MSIGKKSFNGVGLKISIITIEQTKEENVFNTLLAITNTFSLLGGVTKSLYSQNYQEWKNDK